MAVDDEMKIMSATAGNGVVVITDRVKIDATDVEIRVSDEVPGLVKTVVKEIIIFLLRFPCLNTVDFSRFSSHKIRMHTRARARVLNGYRSGTSVPLRRSVHENLLK